MGAPGGGLGALDLDAEDVKAARLLGISLGCGVAFNLETRGESLYRTVGD